MMGRSPEPEAVVYDLDRDGEGAAARQSHLDECGPHFGFTHDARRVPLAIDILQQEYVTRTEPFGFTIAGIDFYLSRELEPVCLRGAGCQSPSQPWGSFTKTNCATAIGDDT